MGEVLYKGLSKDGAYPIPPLAFVSSSSTSNVNSNCLVAVSAQALLWHNKLGHPCSKVLHFAIFDMSFVHVSIASDICSQCTTCISAKMHKLPLLKHVSNSKYPLQLIHSDV